MGSTVMFQGVDKDSTAFKLMKQMGWEEGTGLGKDKQGIKQHVRVKKKNDNSGLGVDEKEKAARNWTFNTSTFDDILKNLKVVTDPDLKEDKEQPTSVADGEEKTTRKVARPQGRYKRREGSKLVRGYSQSDLQAILGGTPVLAENNAGRSKAEMPGSKVVKDETLPSVPTKLRKVKVEVKEELTHIKVVKEEIDLKPVKQELMVVNKSVKQEFPGDNLNVSQQRAFLVKQEPTESKPTGNILSQAAELDTKPVKQEPCAPDWWGNKLGFVRGGQLGSQQPRPVANEAVAATNGRNAFCEQDQENLYKLVQDKATSGKQGLGIGDRPKKIGGVHFKGQKTTFEDDDEVDNAEGSTGNQDPNSASVSQDISAESTAEKRKRNNEEGTEVPRSKTRRKEGAENGDDGKVGTQFKWKKACKEILQEAPARTMSLKRLEKRLIEMLGVPLDQGVNAFDLRNKIERSSQFQLDGKHVSLPSSNLVPQ